jgi:hypothetical protein
MIALGLAAGQAQASDIEVSVKEVSDRRTTGEHFKGLEIDLQLKGYDLEKAVGILPPRLDKAESDFERSLIKEATPGAKFFDLTAHDGDTDHTTTLKLKNPRRKAETVTIAGTVLVVVPSDHPAARLEVKDFLNRAGEPLEAPILEERGIEITYFTREQFEARQEQAEAARTKAQENNEDSAEAVAEALGEAFAEAFGSMFGMRSGFDLNLLIADPDNEILRIAVYDADGEPLKRTRRMAGRPGPKPVHSGIDFEGPLPEDGTLVFLFEHPSAIVEVPFEEVVKLP